MSATGLKEISVAAEIFSPTKIYIFFLKVVYNSPKKLYFKTVFNYGKKAIDGGICPKQNQFMAIPIILYAKNQRFKRYSLNMAA